MALAKNNVESSDPLARYFHGFVIGKVIPPSARTSTPSVGSCFLAPHIAASMSRRGGSVP